MTAVPKHELWQDGSQGWIECSCGARFWTTVEWDAHQSDTAHQVGRTSYDRPLFGGEV